MVADIHLPDVEDGEVEIAKEMSLEQEVSTLAPQMITRVAASTQFVIFFIVFIIMCCFVLFVVINYMISFTRKPRLVGSSITCLH